MNEFPELETHEKIIYHWKNPHRRERRVMDNEASEYIIVENKEASSGIVVYGKFNDKWSANPWSSRPLIKQLRAENKELLERIEVAVDCLPECPDEAKSFLTPALKGE